MIRAAIILLLLATTTTQRANAQATRLPENEIESQYKKLPPLDLLLDSAMVFSPVHKQQDEQIAIRQLQLERKRKQWTEYFNVETYVQYGNNVNVISNTFDTGLNNNLNTSSTQTRYGVGLTFKYPIFNLFSRGKDLSMAKREISAASHQKQVLILELRKSIIELYNRVILSHSLLTAKIEALETSELAVKLAELDFKQSKIGISELSKVTDANMKNITEYQLALSELRLSLELLQEICGYQFLGK